MNKRTKILIFTMVTLLLLAGAAGTFGRKTFRTFKENRAVTQAQGFVKKGDHRSAALSLRIALSINPNNAKAIKMMADLLDQGQSSAALAFRKKAAELEPTLENNLLYAACALRYEQPPFPGAAKALETIGAEGQTNVSFHLLSAQFNLAARNLVKVETHIKAAATLDPTNHLHKLNLATILLQAKETNKAASARSELESYAADPDPRLALIALRSLAADSLARKDHVRASDFAGKARSLPDATLEDRLTYAGALKAAGSPEFNLALTEAQESCGTNTAGLSHARVLTWMNTRGLAEAALDWTAKLPSPTREAMPVQLAQAESYIASTNFTGLEIFLNGRKWGDNEFLRFALLARALREQDTSMHADRLWRQACNAAAANPQRLATLLQLARSWRWETEFRDLLWVAAARTPGQQWPLENLLRDYATANDTEGLYRVYATLLERKTNSVEFKNNVAALGLLLRTNTARCAQLARECYNLEKTNSAVVSTYAFALHTQGNTPEALKLLQALPDSELTRPDVALYYGVMLAATGEHAKAQPYLALAEKRRALPEEQALLENARNR